MNHKGTEHTENTACGDLGATSAVEPQGTQRSQSEKPARERFTLGVNSIRLITSHQASEFVLYVFFAVRCIAEFRFNCGFSVQKPENHDGKFSPGFMASCLIMPRQLERLGDRSRQLRELFCAFSAAPVCIRRGSILSPAAFNIAPSENPM